MNPQESVLQQSSMRRAPNNQRAVDAMEFMDLSMVTSWTSKPFGPQSPILYETQTEINGTNFQIGIHVATSIAVQRSQ